MITSSTLILSLNGILPLNKNCIGSFIKSYLSQNCRVGLTQVLRFFPTNLRLFSIQVCWPLVLICYVNLHYVQFTGRQTTLKRVVKSSVQSKVTSNQRQFCQPVEQWQNSQLKRSRPQKLAAGQRGKFHVNLSILRLIKLTAVVDVRTEQLDVPF